MAFDIAQGQDYAADLITGSVAVPRQNREDRVANSLDTGLQAIVHRLLLHSDLSFEAQRAILDLPAVVVPISAGRDVDRPHDQPKYCSFVLSGLIARYRQISNGERQITAFQISGDLSEFHSAVRPPAFGGVYAIADSVLLRILYPDIRRVAEAVPSFGNALWRECARDFAILSETVVNLGRRDAKARTAHLFCELAVRFSESREPQLSYHFPIKQSDLGSALGITGVHMNRVLANFRMSQILIMKDRQVRILDWRALVSLGDFDAAYLRTTLRA